MEKWKEIHDFPGYSISSEGRVRNDSSGRIMSLTLNQQGIVQVGFTVRGRHFKRGVALLVARAFLSHKMGAFDTVINLDGDRLNNSMENLAWRPRWFAIHYHRQFRHRYAHAINRPVIDSKTLKVSPTSFDACIEYGLLERDLVESIHNRTYVWPTMQIFKVVE